MKQNYYIVYSYRKENFAGTASTFMDLDDIKEMNQEVITEAHEILKTTKNLDEIVIINIIKIAN